MFCDAFLQSSRMIKLSPMLCDAFCKALEWRSSRHSLWYVTAGFWNDKTLADVLWCALQHSNVTKLSPIFFNVLQSSRMTRLSPLFCDVFWRVLEWQDSRRFFCDALLQGSRLTKLSPMFCDAFLEASTLTKRSPIYHSTTQHFQHTITHRGGEALNLRILERRTSKNAF